MMTRDNVERRHFFRFPYERNICYKKLILAERKIIETKLHCCVSRNLSASGILFISKDQPCLSDIILLDLDYNKALSYNTVEKDILTLNNKPVAKVVRVEEIGNGQYKVGVVFLTKSRNEAIDIRRLITNMKWHRYAAYFFMAIFILSVVFATLSVNLLYLERKNTYHPSKHMYITPADIGIAYEDINIKTEDGQSINGWFIPTKDAEATILFCPGNRGNICDQLARIKFFHTMKLNLLMFDYRGYGKSSGKPSEQGLYKDARAAYDFLISRNDIDKNKIIVFGESLGGAVAADLCLKRPVQALVLESPIVSLAMHAKELYPFLPTKFLLPEKYDTLSKIKKIHIPKMIVHGLDDERIPFDDALRLYYTAPLPKQFLPFEGAHNDDIFKISDTYRDQLNTFFRDNDLL